MLTSNPFLSNKRWLADSENLFVRWLSFLCVMRGALLLASSAELRAPVLTRPKTAGRGRHDFNQDWQFVKDVDTVSPPRFLPKRPTARRGGQQCRCPIPPSSSPLSRDKTQWQGISFYRKFFQVACHRLGQAGSRCTSGPPCTRPTVYLNGQRLQRHLGGYLPFTVDISRQVEGAGELTAGEARQPRQPRVPPGKPLKGLDFNFYSGLYRPVQLLIHDPLHITDAVQAGRPAAGASAALRKHQPPVGHAARANRAAK